MSGFPKRSAGWYGVVLGMCSGLTFILGCGDSGSKLIPVAGKVTVNGQPLTTGTGQIACRPEKGTATTEQPAATIEPDGTYHLVTNGKDGAPPGRYRVLVVDVEPLDPKSGFPYGKRKSNVNAKYSDPKTSDLVIDVKEAAPPGAYDLKLSK